MRVPPIEWSHHPLSRYESLQKKLSPVFLQFVTTSAAFVANQVFDIDVAKPMTTSTTTSSKTLRPFSRPTLRHSVRNGFLSLAPVGFSFTIQKLNFIFMTFASFSLKLDLESLNPSVSSFYPLSLSLSKIILVQFDFDRI